MGKLYALKIAAASGNRQVHVCDRVELYDELCMQFQSTPNIQCWQSGFDVVRRADFMCVPKLPVFNSLKNLLGGDGEY